MPLFEPPSIEGDPAICFDIFIHESLQPLPLHSRYNPEYGTPERLADVGWSALQLAITLYFFSRDEQATDAELRERREQFFDDASIMNVAQSYGFRDRIRMHPDRPDVRESPQEMRKLVNKYAGALYIRSGLGPIQAWVQQIMEPDEEPIMQPTHPDPPLYDNSWRRSPPQPPPMSSPPPSTGRPFSPAAPPPTPSFPPLMLVNQTAMQRGHHLTYSPSQTGPAHVPTWTVACLVDGVERGRGTGKSQKVAKEEAARQAWRNMGWG
ncbi:hypothetical protein AX16_008156, partial [Volvariella volvacea WC 439]